MRIHLRIQNFRDVFATDHGASFLLRLRGRGRERAIVILAKAGEERRGLRTWFDACYHNRGEVRSFFLEAVTF